ncbi:MAG: four helix bundle protein [bacterium]|nr:four helix bundle protein [bacterium]
MSAPTTDRPKATRAQPELLLLARFEELTTWLLQHTARWPKRTRFTLTQRIENHALDALEALVLARYQTHQRPARLLELNLLFERMRYLLRAARATQACPARTFEQAMRRLDETGRMLHGWRKQLNARTST